MPTQVLDSWALLAFFKDEPAAEVIERIIEAATKSGKPLLLSAINWAEIYYTMERAGGRPVAESVAAEISSLPITVVGIDEDLELARQAAQFKATHKLSLANAFAAALASDRNAELVTGDPEFRALEREVKIVWLE